MSGHAPHFGHVKRVLTPNGRHELKCDICNNTPEDIVLIVRGGYVQEQVCEQCEKEKSE